MYFNSFIYLYKVLNVFFFFSTIELLILKIFKPIKYVVFLKMHCPVSSYIQVFNTDKTNPSKYVSFTNDTYLYQFTVNACAL